MLSDLIKKRESKVNEFENFYDIQKSILQGQASDSEILNLFQNLETFSLSPVEFQAAISASVQEMVKIPTTQKVLDIVGTGGDRLNTFNISTLSALVCACLGVKVAKHGNNSSTSVSGSSDVLEGLGVNLDLKPSVAAEILDKCGFVFCYAKKFNPAFKHVATARKKFSKPTYFNILGPCLNPARPKFMLLGYSDNKAEKLLSSGLMNSGVEKLYLVKSSENMDEVSTFSSTEVKYFSSDPAMVESFKVNGPAYFKNSQSVSSLTDIVVSSKTQAIEYFLKVLNSKTPNPLTDIVSLNAAMALVLTSRVEGIMQGIELSNNIIFNGELKNFFTKFKQLTNQY